MSSILGVLAELERRAAAREEADNKAQGWVDMIYNSLIPQQRAVVDSDKNQMAVICSRRAGKTWAVAAKMVIQCLLKPQSQCLYVALTHKNVRKISKTVFEKIFIDFNIPVTVNLSQMSISFDNGSVIWLDAASGTAGAGARAAAVEKYVGTAYDLIDIDECGSYAADMLHFFIYSILVPALAERKGTLILSGTPRKIMSGPFYDITTRKPEDWEVFEWSTFDNTYISKEWKERVENLIKTYPDVEQQPWFIRDYQGKWAKDLSNMVYKFSEDNLTTEELGNEVRSYVLGVDIGWNDASAFVLCSWKKHSSVFEVHESFKKTEMLPDEISAVIKSFQNRYQPLNVVIDGSNKTVVQQMAQRYGVYTNLAEKTDKRGWIELLNVDFVKRNVIIYQLNNIHLVKELSELPWRTLPNNKQAEHEAFDNHLCDALLYAYRYGWHYLEKPKEVLTEEELIYKQEMEEERKRASEPWWKRGR